MPDRSFPPPWTVEECARPRRIGGDRGTKFTSARCRACRTVRWWSTAGSTTTIAAQESGTWGTRAKPLAPPVLADGFAYLKDRPPLPAAIVANGGVSYTLQAQTQQQIEGCREGVLSRLRWGDRAGCDRGDCSQQSAGAGGPGICRVPIHACWRLSAAASPLPCPSRNWRRALSLTKNDVIYLVAGAPPQFRS